VNSVQLNSGFSVAPQIRPADLPAIAAAGFRGIVNNRPDGETPDQPPSQEIEAAAKRLGLAYAHIPVVPGEICGAQAQGLDDFLAQAQGPVLGFCRTGTRAVQLWALQQAAHGNVEDILSAASRAGYDLASLRPRLEAAR